MNRPTIPSLAWCVQNTSDWPRWPMLPIKNSRDVEPGHFPRLGVLVDCADGLFFVADANVCCPSDVATKLKDAPIADIAALEAEGWRVD